jgi:hypothetical protein
MEKCPYCDSNSGVYTTFTGKQYYDWNGTIKELLKLIEKHDITLQLNDEI